MDPLTGHTAAWHCRADTGQTQLDCRNAVGTSRVAPIAVRLDEVLITQTTATNEMSACNRE